MPYLSRIRINPLRAESRKLLASPRALHAAVEGGLPGLPGPSGLPGLPGPSGASGLSGLPVPSGLPERERTLWRLDPDNPHRPQLFVLTTGKPDWTHLVEQAGWPGADGEHYAVRDYAPLLRQLAPGRAFAFRLTANPVQNTSRPDKPTPRQQERIDIGNRRGFRVGHRTATAQLNWFLTRTARWGFEVPAAPELDGAHDMDGTQGANGTHRADGEPPRDIRIITRRRHSFGKGPGTAKEAHVVMNTVTFEGRLRVTDPALLTERLLSGIGPSKAYGCGLLTLAPLTGRA